jgi:deoxyribonuclease V
MLPLLRPPRLNLEELAEIQRRIATTVKEKDDFKKLERIAGCDISFARGGKACAACVVLDYRNLEILEKHVKHVKLKFPYIPTFLAFRELEGMLKVTANIDADVFMIGAQGLAHPRRAGLACHLGVVLNRPSLGVAKSKLIGDAKTPANRRGSWTHLRDGREVIGAAVRTQPNSKPVYVSIGHKLTLKTAIGITLDTTRDHRLPEPLRVAHELATEAMRKL